MYFLNLENDVTGGINQALISHEERKYASVSANDSVYLAPRYYGFRL